MPGELKTGATCERCGLTTFDADAVAQGICPTCEDTTLNLVVQTNLPIGFFRTESIVLLRSSDGRTDRH